LGMGVIAYFTIQSLAYCTRQGLDETLWLWCHAACFRCSDGQLSPWGWRWRITCGLWIRRARCKYCGLTVSFLPIFVAPAKWYDYPTIDSAVRFVLYRNRMSFPSLTSALIEWEMQRSDRCDNGNIGGPCWITVYRWYRILADLPATAWQDRFEDAQRRAVTSPSPTLSVEAVTSTVARVSVVQAVAPPARASSTPAPNTPARSARWESETTAIEPPFPPASANDRIAELPAYSTLRRLGKTFVQGPLRHLASSMFAPLLAFGAWFVDTLFGGRCLAGPEARGCIAIAMQHDMKWSKVGHDRYPPAKAEHPP